MPAEDEHRVAVHLDRLLALRGMTLTELADRVGVTLVNLSVLKNGRGRAIRFTTLTAICDALECQPGDLFSVRAPDEPLAPRTAHEAAAPRLRSRRLSR